MGRKKRQSGDVITKDYSPVTMYIATKIQTIREGKGLTQTDLAKLMGVNRISIVSAESGRSTSITRLYEIAEALNVSINDLFPSITWYIESKHKRAIKKIIVELV